MKLIFKIFLLYLLVSIVYSTSLTTTTESKTKTLSREEIEELEKLENEKLASLELEKAKLDAEEREKVMQRPTKEQLETLSPREREILMQKAQKVPIRNVPIFNINKDVIWKGWIKYFHYPSDTKMEKPNHFYENPTFFTELVKMENKEDRSPNGFYKYIQDKNHFWCKLLRSGNLNILGSRRNEKTTLADNVENLNTDLIGYVHPENNANGAIKDLGSFNEGHCLSISTVVPEPKKDLNYNPRTQSGEEITWIICTDRGSQKKQLMSSLVSLKIERQRIIKDFGLEEQTNSISVAQLMQVKPIQPKIEKYNGRGASVDDGYWILLQDWSTCSLKCGGGEQTQQWLCVPPKNQGKPCVGVSIRRKPCNDKPCPSTTVTGIIKADDSTHITLKPIYKALPYSKRPQQYVKCLIKENDVLYKTKEYDPEKKTSIKVPGRIVMNTKTISIYKDDGYNNLLFSFNLSDTVFSKSASDYCCFILSNANREYEMCGFNNNCGTVENPVWVAKWGFDFEYFQSKCYKELKESSKNANSATNIPPSMGGPTVDASGSGAQQQQEVVNGRREVINQKIEEIEQKNMDDKVGTTQKVALTALRREINLEDMIKNEEIQKGKDESQLLYKQMNQEKKKKELLEQALVQREKNFGQVRVAKETQKKIDGIKNETKVDIKFKRGVLKKKLEEIRTKFRRKHRQIKQQIQMIRSEMAQDIVDANRKGNQQNCKDGRNRTDLIEKYCNKHFSDDYSKNLSCKDPGNFCYSCCEAEFGNMFINQRDDCQSMCDDLEKQDLNNGDFVWVAGNPPGNSPSTAPPRT